MSVFFEDTESTLFIASYEEGESGAEIDISNPVINATNFTSESWYDSGEYLKKSIL